MFVVPSVSRLLYPREDPGKKEGKILQEED
jgi:hypothetical protein